MIEKNIIATVKLAHKFGSAFDREMVWRLLPLKMNYAYFEKRLTKVIDSGLLFEKKGKIFYSDNFENSELKEKWSRDLFIENKMYLKYLNMLPWIKFVALTGANAFQSCKEKDDVDLFIITKKKRLWLSYIVIVLLSKLFKKREVLCINYLVDDEHLRIEERNYYTAVQLITMIPLIKNELSSILIKKNDWINNFLPNAPTELPVNQFYLLNRNKKISSIQSGISSKILARANNKLFFKYSRHLQKKYSGQYGKGIRLAEGFAKLNRINHSNVYDDYLKEVKEVPV